MARNRSTRIPGDSADLGNNDYEAKENDKLMHHAIQRQLNAVAPEEKLEVKKSLSVEMCSDSMKTRWKKGKKAADSLQQMLDSPPQAKAIVNDDRIEELLELKASDQMLDRIRAYNGLVLASQYFDTFMAAIIICNSAFIGLEQNMASELKDTIAYSTELAMHALEGGWMHLLEDSWMKFDTFLVITGIITTWILTPIMGNLDGIGPLLVLRMVRLLRLARMVRLLHQFKELWTLVQGFKSSVSTMGYTTLLLFLVMYGFACLGMELIFNSDSRNTNAEFKEIVDQHFCNLPRIMLTLLQFIAMDSVAAIYKPLCIENGWLVLYFFSIIMTVAVVLMNIVTAVIVNTALEAHAQDAEARGRHKEHLRKCISSELGSLFEFFATDDGQGVDDDDANSITLEELLSSPVEAQRLLCQLTDSDCLEDIFEEIDFDGDGALSIEEFTQGILNIVGSDVPRMVRSVQASMKNFSLVIQRIEAKLDGQAVPRPSEARQLSPVSPSGLLKAKVDAVAKVSTMVESVQTDIKSKKKQEEPTVEVVLPASSGSGLRVSSSDQDCALLPAVQQLLQELDNIHMGIERKLRSVVMTQDVATLADRSANGDAWSPPPQNFSIRFADRSTDTRPKLKKNKSPPGQGVGGTGATSRRPQPKPQNGKWHSPEDAKVMAEQSPPPREKWRKKGAAA